MRRRRRSERERVESLINDRGKLFKLNDEFYDEVDAPPLELLFDSSDYLGLTEDGFLFNTRTLTDVALVSDGTEIRGIRDVIVSIDRIYVLARRRVFVSNVINPRNLSDVIRCSEVRSYNDVRIITADSEHKRIFAQFYSGHWEVIDHIEGLATSKDDHRLSMREELRMREQDPYRYRNYYDDYIGSDDELVYVGGRKYTMAEEYKQESNHINQYHPYGHNQEDYDDITQEDYDDITQELDNGFQVLPEFYQELDLIQYDRGLFTDGGDNLYIIMDLRMYKFHIEGLVDAKISSRYGIHILVRDPDITLINLNYGDIPYHYELTIDMLRSDIPELSELDNQVGVRRLIVIQGIAMILLNDGKLYNLDSDIINGKRYYNLKEVDIPPKIFASGYNMVKNSRTRIV